MLLGTLATKTLPVLLKEETKTKSALFMIFHKEYPNYLCLNSTGDFIEAERVKFWDSETKSFCYFVTAPKYATVLDEQFRGTKKSVYSPSALLSAGFISNETFEVIARQEITMLETHSGLKATSEVSNNPTQFLLRRLYLQEEYGRTLALPGSSLDPVEKNEDDSNPSQDVTTVDVAATDTTNTAS